MPHAVSDFLVSLMPPSIKLIAGAAAAAVNGLPACNSRDLLQTGLRERLGFEGFVSTDCKGA